jgi:hypothetical protein
MPEGKRNHNHSVLTKTCKLQGILLVPPKIILIFHGALTRTSCVAQKALKIKGQQHYSWLYEKNIERWAWPRCASKTKTNAFINLNLAALRIQISNQRKYVQAYSSMGLPSQLEVVDLGLLAFQRSILVEYLIGETILFHCTKSPLSTN